MDAFDMLDERVRRWVWLQGWDDLRPIQRNAIAAVIGADRDVVLGAPTAAGKTEAAYLPILSNLLQNPVRQGYAVLNLSPLKALINDQYQRLQGMTGDMGINVTPWHSDVAHTTKKASLARPSGILLITPESLESMLVNRPHQLERAFANLRYVVIDELHAFMGGERGVQLQSQLSRIEALIGRKVPRIALSATFADYRQAETFLRPRRAEMSVEVPDAGKGGHETMVLIKEFVAIGELQYDDAVAHDIYRNLRGENNLVFANSRKEAETVALNLKDLCKEQGVPNEFVVHHGSLSKNDREQVEHRLKEGTHPTTAICTSTLELGVDIGKVKSIAQLVTANSVSSLRQRLGRSGRRGTPSILRIYSLDEERDDYKYHLRTNLVQNIAVIELLSQSSYEKTDMKVPHYSTLIQQILSVTAQYGGFYPQDAYRLLCRNGAFNNIPADEFIEILHALGAKDILSQTSTGQIVIGKDGERIVRSLDFYTAFVTLKDFNVVDQSSGRVIGSVQYKPYVGEYILLSAHRWLVESIDDRSGKIMVSAAHTTGKLMFEGYGQEIDGLITQKMRDIYMSDDVYPYLDSKSGADEGLLEARKSFRGLGLDHKSKILVGGSHLLFTWGGMRLNRTLALMHKAAGYKMPSYDAFAVADVPEEYLKRLISNPPDAETLVQDLPRYRKETEKFDYLLPERLLNKKYAAQSLML